MGRFHREVRMPSVQPRYSMEEFQRRGDLIYERDIEPHLRSEDHGKHVSIDIETGAYEIDADEMESVHRLRARVPDAQVWARRVGYRYVHHFGGRTLMGES
jgi:hypothetical protein